MGSTKILSLTLTLIFLFRDLFYVGIETEEGEAQ